MSTSVTSHENAKKGKTPKQLKSWLAHVDAVQAKHPKMKRKAVLKLASKSYKKTGAAKKSKAKPKAKRAGKKPCKTGATRVLKSGTKKRGLTSWDRFRKAMKKEGRTFKSKAARRTAYLAWMKKSGCAKPKKARKPKAKSHKNATVGHKNAMTAAENQPMSFEDFERVWMAQNLAHANARRAAPFADSYAQSLVAHPNRRAATRRVQNEEDFLIDDDEEDMDAVAHENARRRRRVRGGRRRAGRRLADAEEEDGEMELLEGEL
jgi:hypothetical protein